MTDTETLTDEQALELEEQERTASQAVTGPATIEPDADGAATPDTEAEPETGKEKENQTVPLAAMLKDREKYQGKIAELEAKAAKQEAMFQKFLEIQKPDEAPKKPEIPAFDDKPLEHLNARLQQVADAQQKQGAYQQQAAAQQAVIQQINGHEAVFRQTNPDYLDAVGFAKAARMNELRVLGYPEAQLRPMVDAEAFQLAVNTMQQGGNPAETFYNYAKHRGYQKAAPVTDASTQKFVDKQAIKERTQGLPSGGRAPKSRPPTLEELANSLDVDDPKFEEKFMQMREMQRAQ